MNCGLGNLDGLKKHLLADTLVGEKRFDLVIQDIGLGVAALMENYCDRNFVRVVGDQVTLPADRASFLLPRYPIEAVTAVEMKFRDADGWQAQDSSLIESTSPLAGIVYLDDHVDGGPYWAQVRFTYTGGYFFETAEPEDDAYPTAQPAGSRLLPADVRLAWLIQCEQLWQVRDKLGLSLIGGEGTATTTKVASLDLVPMVKTMLTQFRRIQPI